MATDIFDWNDLDSAIQGTNGSEDTGDYVLQNDLDSSTAGYSGIGDSWQPCGENATGSQGSGFQGTFDGNGFEIRELVIDDNSHDTSVGKIGLFGSTDGGDGTTVIENLGVRGTIGTTDNSGLYAGLIVGYHRDANELRNCYAEGTVNVPNMSQVGGVVGRNASPITNCYTLAAVTGDEFVGGFCGANYDTIQTSYSTGSVAGNTDFGGFTGATADTETDCYWDTETSGQSTSSGTATGLTTSEMQGSSASTNLSGFDFTGTWGTITGDSEATGNVGYPILQALDADNQYTAQGLTYDPALNPTLTMGGDDIVEITIDGTAVTGLTIDGDPVE